MHILPADQTAAQESARFVIQLFAYLLPDAPELLRSGFDWLGINHLFDHWKIIRQPLDALLALAFGVFHRWGNRDEWTACGQLHEQFELIAVELFAAGTEDALDQQIDHLP